MPKESKLTCGFTHWRGTPVFALPLAGQEVKRILGATLLRDRGIWLFPAYYPFTEDVVRDLTTVFPKIRFNDKAQAHIETSRALAAQIENGGVEYRNNFQFVTVPYEHQEDALRFALGMLRCGIFYDCGLGKTKIVVDLLRHEGGKTLVLVPTIGVQTWVDEVALHSGGELRATALQGTPKKKDKIIEEAAPFDILAVSYDTAKRYFDKILEFFPFQTIVADESHYLRGHRSARTKCALALASYAKRRLILSGTPSLGNPMHLWGQLSFLGKHIPAKNFWAFKLRHTVTAPYNKKMVIGFKNMDMLNDKVSRVAIRRKKEECLDLPKRTIVDIPFELNPSQKKTYNELVASSVAELANGELYEAAHAAVVIQKLLQILSGFMIISPPNICDGCFHLTRCVESKIRAYTQNCIKEQHPPPEQVVWFKSNLKLQATEELLDTLLAEESNKVIIWAHFTKELNTVEDLLQKKGWGYIRVDGRNSSQAQNLSKEFNANPEKRVWLGQIQTGVALTLTAAAYMVYYGLNYSLDAYLQSMDRNFRIGQDKPVFVYRMTCAGSILEYVIAALSQKIDIANTLTDRINCIFCDRSLSCIIDGSTPFQKNCKYEDKTARIVTRPKKM